MKRFGASALSAVVALVVLAGCGGGTPPAGPGKVDGTNPNGGPMTDPAKVNPTTRSKYRIAVIPKSTSHEFWKQVEAGAMSAVKGDEHYEIVFKAGEPGDDANAQLTLTERMIGQGFDAIVLAPVHSKFLVQAVEKAYEKKVPMVIIDSGVEADFSHYSAFVATDNKDGGAQCARRLAKSLGGKGTILLLRYEAGSASTMERELGFTETLAKEFPAIKIAAEKYAGPTRETSLKNANELIAANPGFDGVFACNESSTFGMLLALREKGLAGKVKFVGFDTAKELVEAVDKGEIEALAAQNPFMIGAEGVKQVIKALSNGKADSIVIPAIMKDKDYFKREAEEEKLKADHAQHIEDEKKNEAGLKGATAELEKKSAEQRAILAAEEEKLKLLNKEDEAFKKRESELAKMKAELDQKAEEEKKKIEAEFAKQQEAIRLQIEEDKKREAELIKQAEAAAAEQKKKVDAALAEQKAIQEKFEAAEKARAAELARIQEEDAKAAEAVKAKLAAEAKKREDLQRAQEEEEKKLAAEVKRIAEESKKKEEEMRKKLEEMEKAEAAKKGK